MADPIVEFVMWLKKSPGVDATVDRPDDPRAISFIDTLGRSGGAQVSFQPSVGFGISVSSDVFGQRPDKLIDDPRSAAKHVLESIEDMSTDTDRTKVA